jgi:hypothetical protein
MISPTPVGKRHNLSYIYHESIARAFCISIFIPRALPPSAGDITHNTFVMIIFTCSREHEKQWVFLPAVSGCHREEESLLAFFRIVDVKQKQKQASRNSGHGGMLTVVRGDFRSIGKCLE